MFRRSQFDQAAGQHRRLGAAHIRRNDEARLRIAVDSTVPAARVINRALRGISPRKAQRKGRRF
jgi:hypothetical protein